MGHAARLGETWIPNLGYIGDSCGPEQRCHDCNSNGMLERSDPVQARFPRGV